MVLPVEGLSPPTPISNQDNSPHPHRHIYRPVWSGESLHWDPLTQVILRCIELTELIGTSCGKVQTGNSVVTHFFGPVLAAQELGSLSFCLRSFHVWTDNKLLSKTSLSQRSVKIIFPIYQTRTWSQYLIWPSTAGTVMPVLRPPGAGKPPMLVRTPSSFVS